LCYYGVHMRETSSVYEEDLNSLAERVIELLSQKETGKAKLIFLEGDLGAGKTTFTKSLATLLGIEKEEVHSPTFILKKEYTARHPKFKKLIHIDAYRFLEPHEAKILHLDEDRENPAALIAIEWPSKMPKVNPDLTLSFSVVDDTRRTVTISYEEEQ